MLLVKGCEERSNVQVVARIMNVSIERDSNGSLGITLRGGAQPDPDLTKPLIITQVRPGGAADRLVYYVRILKSIIYLTVNITKYFFHIILNNNLCSPIIKTILLE